MSLSPANPVRCQGHKSSHYVRKIAVLSLTKSCTLSWLKADTKFLTLGNFSPMGDKGGEWGARVEGGMLASKSHTPYSGNLIFKKRRKEREEVKQVGSSSKISPF